MTPPVAIVVASGNEGVDITAYPPQTPAAFEE